MMTNRVLEEFQDALQNDHAARDGNILLERIRAIVQSFIPTERDLVVQALREWLGSGEDVLVIQAAIMAKEFRIRELAGVLARARDTFATEGSKSIWILDEALNLITTT